MKISQRCKFSPTSQSKKKSKNFFGPANQRAKSASEKKLATRSESASKIFATFLEGGVNQVVTSSMSENKTRIWVSSCWVHPIRWFDAKQVDHSNRHIPPSWKGHPCNEKRKQTKTPQVKAARRREWERGYRSSMQFWEDMRTNLFRLLKYAT